MESGVRRAEVLASVRAMATGVTVHGAEPGSEAERLAARRALEVFGQVERACTRFDPLSPLMRVNAHPERWHTVPGTLHRALLEAHAGYQRTRGRFDPRVLGDLVGLGYDRSLRFSDGEVRTRRRGSSAPHARRGRPWCPRFRGGPEPQVLVGPDPVDLGGIGKGLALRWSAARLARAVPAFLVEAGGDIVCRGPGPAGNGWMVGIEDPFGGAEPVAVVALEDLACATSSVRLRRWRCDGVPAHHLIDPRTGRPGGQGLAAVTVLAADPAEAEVLSKVLFLEGGRGIEAAASRRRAAALWVDSAGRLGATPAFARRVVWSAS